MMISNLPLELQNKIMFYVLEHPCAKMIKDECIKQGLSEKHEFILNDHGTTYYSDDRDNFSDFYFETRHASCYMCNNKLVHERLIQRVEDDDIDTIVCDSCYSLFYDEM